MADEFTELTLRVRKWDEAKGYYPVEAEAGDGSRYEDGRLTIDKQALLQLDLNPLGYGEALFNALFAGEIRRAYDKTTARAEAVTGGRLRVRFWVDNDAVELHAIPWERLYHLSRGNFVPLTTSTNTPFSRYTSLETPEPAPVSERPLKILAAIANPNNLPGGLAPADAERELSILHDAIGDLRANKDVEVRILLGRSDLPGGVLAQWQAEGYKIIKEPTSLANIKRYLPGTHVFHYIGHGAFKPAERGEGVAALYLEQDDGTYARVIDSEIVTTFSALGNLPHLVFMVACESATRDAAASHPFVGLGPKLVQAGVPVVVAMQKQVPVALARDLTGEFYRRLIEHGEVDQALSQARYLIFKPKETDWSIPVIFSRLRGGKLFKTTQDIEEEKRMAEEQGNKQEVSGNDNAVVQGSNNTTNVNKTAKQEGGVNFNISGGGNFSIGGDVVGRDKVTNTTVNYGAGVDPNKMAALLKEFEGIKKKVANLDGVEDEDKDDLKTNVQRLEDEVKKGDGADATKAEKAIKKIAAMSDDILKVVVATLTNPAAGVAKAIQLIAEKAKS